MRWTIIALAGILLLLIVTALIKGGGIFQDGVKTSLDAGFKFLPIIIVALLIMGFADALLPKNFVNNWLSDSAGFRGIGHCMAGRHYYARRLNYRNADSCWPL